MGRTVRNPQQDLAHGCLRPSRGATVAPVESISLETMAADVFTIMDALEIDRYVLAGEFWLALR
ncbi:MAG: hypothetical protein R2844_19875 [Caldilineales bacterium]